MFTIRDNETLNQKMPYRTKLKEIRGGKNDQKILYKITLESVYSLYT